MLFQTLSRAIFANLVVEQIKIVLYKTFVYFQFLSFLVVNTEKNTNRTLKTFKEGQESTNVSVWSIYGCFKTKCDE